MLKLDNDSQIERIEAASEMTPTHDPCPLPRGLETNIRQPAEVLVLLQGAPLVGQAALEDLHVDAARTCPREGPLTENIACTFLTIASRADTSPAILTPEETWT
jgi:hypothetical protein